MDTGWVQELQPRLAEIEARIAELETELQRLREMRQGLVLLLDHSQREHSTHTIQAPAALSASESRRKTTAKELLVRFLTEAGQPLLWAELQRRILQSPDPPNAGTLASAFYHNTKRGTRTFIAFGNGYAGLAGRDEGWEPPTTEA